MMAKNLIFRHTDSNVSSADFSDIVIKNIKFQSNCDTDDWMNTEIAHLSNSETFCNIFIPLCFGTYLTDFLGLRFALHIRTSPGNNQMSNIFLYGTESINAIMHEEFFSILQTKGVFLIDNCLAEIKKHAECSRQVLESKSSLIKELDKIHLTLPKNLHDKHSVANIWGMHRLMELEGLNTNQLAILNSKKNRLNNIYFKWLLAKNHSEQLINKEVETARQRYSIPLAGIKVLGKIDLSTFQKNKKKR